MVVGRRAMAKASHCVACKLEEVLLGCSGKRRGEASLLASSLWEWGCGCVCDKRSGKELVRTY